VPAPSLTVPVGAPAREVAPSTGRTGRGIGPVVVVAAVFVGLVAYGWYGQSAAVPSDREADGHRLSTLYDPPDRPVEAALNARDGQVFAALAVDPTIRRPELIRGGAGEVAYRHQRPLLGWTGWLVSGGDPERVPWALVAVSALSVVAMVAAAALALRRLGAPPALAGLLLVLPGSLADITFVGPEALGCALLVAGVLEWTRPAPSRRSILLALAAFALAGLCRETLLVVPAALALRELARGRLRPTALLAATAAPYVAWVVVLRSIVGSWPVGTVSGRLSVVPFAGLVEAAPSWPPGEVLAIGATIALAGAGLALGRDPAWRVAIGANLVLAAALGEPVWARSADVGRVLLPGAVLGLVALGTRWRPSSGAEPVEPADNRADNRADDPADRRSEAVLASD